MKNILAFVGDIVGGIYGLYTFSKALIEKLTYGGKDEK